MAKKQENKQQKRKPPKKALPKSRARPLLARPGARFECFSDGLCCSDIHALGPMTRSEVKAVQKLLPNAVVLNDEVEGHCMRPAEDGGCAQLQKGLCGIHANHGAQHKPSGCRRFPYGLVSTPLGGRITTEQRCPCRTLGERPPIDLRDAERSLLDNAGRIEVDQEAPTEVEMTVEEQVSFAEYAAVETRMLERLAAGDKPEDVLCARPFPGLCKSAWQVQAAEFLDMKDDTAGGVAMEWFGDAILAVYEGYTPPQRRRPWAGFFNKGIARSKHVRDSDEMINDWVSDEIWMLRWLEWDCPFDVARVELATRVACVRWLVDTLQSEGLRPDQATAEAIMIVELGACTNQWPETVDAIANDPSPAEPITG